MFESLPKHFNNYGLNAKVQTLLLLQKSFEKGLIKTLGDLHNVLKAVVVCDPKQIGPFTLAFYDYFLDIKIHPNENLKNAFERDESFKNWKDEFLQKNEFLDNEELITKFLDEIHLSQYDINEIINGQEIWNKDKADLHDQETIEQINRTKNPQKIVDYSALSMHEILERMKEVAKQQKSKHSGGSHWIGTAGHSAYGHGGAAKNGIRVGGTGGGKMARAVIGDPNYYPVDLSQTLNDNSIDATLSSLKGILEDSSQEFLDVNLTISEGLKRGGLFLPEIKNDPQKKLQVLLFIDNGGYSMLYYVKIIQQLFKKMKVRFAHDLETYYFHNTIYNEVYSDAQRTKAVGIDRILEKDPNYRVFIIGDASMAPYELTNRSLDFYKKLKNKFKKTVWINPERENEWPYTSSIQMLKNIIPMFPMTPRGIEMAVLEMNKLANLHSQL